jgi:hypothetical protein
MKWFVHPAKDNMTKAVLVALFVVAFVVYIGIFIGVFWALFGFIVLFLSSYSFYFPTYYEITEDSIIIKGIFARQQRSLKEFKKILEGKNGVLLSPFRRKTFLNRFRGVFLFLPPKRQEILGLLRERIEEPAAKSEIIDTES